MAVEILEVADLETVRPDKLVTLLFAYRRDLLNAARDSAQKRQIIFDSRAEIARVFRQFGGERHQESVKQFETLEKPDDLLEFAPPKNEQKPERHERVFHRPGFYVFGDKLDEDQVKSIRAQNRTGLKVGNQIPLTLVELFRVKDDNKPIYVNQPVTERLQEQIAVLIQLRPSLVGRLHFLRWENGQAVIEPYTSSTLVVVSSGLSEIKGEAVQILKNFIYHQPKSGEIFVGRVSRACEFGVFVEFLPGIEGLVHRSEVPRATDEDCRTLFNCGEEMIVEIIKIDRNGNIRLSAKSAAEKIVQGEQPLFADVQMQLLLTAGQPAV